ncbi:MAG TPA: (d)CMP kinase [Vicinamibacterales bacterium]|nr:(d)CMP kinase [Vicinamibacterales bacterium]
MDDDSLAQGLPPPLRDPSGGLNARAAAVIEVILCSGLPTQLALAGLLALAGIAPYGPDGALSPAYVFVLPLADAVLLLGLVTWFLRLHGERVSDVMLGGRPLLREAAVRGSLGVEGRDIGTVVFPDAVLKVHLHAALPVRAERRQADLRRQGIDMPAGEVSRDLEERDRRDSTRADSPLRQAEGALVLDTSRCSIDEQVDAILRAYFAAVRATRAPEGPAGPEASRPPEGERP